MSKKGVFEMAKDGRESVENDQCQAAPVLTPTDTNANRLRTLFTSERRLSILTLSEELTINERNRPQHVTRVVPYTEHSRDWIVW